MNNVLYDAPGPRAKRRTLIASIVAALAIVAVAYFVVYRRLAERGQFTMARWGALIDPDHRHFEALWTRLGEGALNTLMAAAVAILTSLVVGTLLAMLRLHLQTLKERRYATVPAALAPVLRLLTRVLTALTRVFVEIFRGLPLVITIYFVARFLPENGLKAPTLVYLVVGLTLYNGVVIAEILRSGMSGLPHGQGEAAASIGLSPLQTTWIVLLPQAFRIMLPALISQMVVILKDTSLGFIITYNELLNVAGNAINTLRNPIQIYFVIGLMFLIINYALSKLATYVERRLARSRRAVANVNVDQAVLEANRS